MYPAGHGVGNAGKLAVATGRKNRAGGHAMWFLCAIAGAVLGAMVGQLSGFFIGAVLGGLVGAAYERRARLQDLERRLSALEKAVPKAAEPAAPKVAEVTRTAEPAPEPEPARPV